MNRREFVKMAPALPAAAVTASITLREHGRDPVELDISVLKCQPGDTLVLSVPKPLTVEELQRLKAIVENVFDGRVKVIVLSDGVTLDGVIRA